MDYDKIISDRKLFNETVYTPLSEALRLLEERRKDPELVKKVEEFLDGDIPECFKGEGVKAVHFRQIATPNFDARWFLELAQDHSLKPIFFEYFNDKFTSNNEFKHSLGQLRIHGKINKNGDHQRDLVTIVDFNKFNGKKLSEVKTIWNQNLVDLHRELFSVFDVDLDKITFYDGSNWFYNNGEKSQMYYKKFLALFLCHGILFENFLLTGSEGEFSKTIVLPAIDYLNDKFNVKPFIVPIPPMEVEDNEHWISYTKNVQEFVKNRYANN